MLGIEHMHKKDIVHLDIKLENLLLDGQGRVKIADFGLSQRLKYQNQRIFGPYGTIGYFAPEIVEERGYKGFPVDCWAAGVCLFVLLNGVMPFKMYPLHALSKIQ